MSLRIVLAILAGAAVLALCACGGQEEVTAAETEGVYLDLGDLKYQVQVSRAVNPADAQDREFFLGLPAGTTTALPGDEIWFAVFLRVENPTDQPQLVADRFEIEDTQGARYAPIALDPSRNPLVYRTGMLRANGRIPVPDSAVDQSFAQGGLLLFRIKTASNQNRPLVFKISNVEGSFTGTVDLDV